MIVRIPHTVLTPYLHVTLILPMHPATLLYHIREVAALNAKLLMDSAFATPHCTHMATVGVKGLMKNNKELDGYGCELLLAVMLSIRIVCKDLRVVSAGLVRWFLRRSTTLPMMMANSTMQRKTLTAIRSVLLTPAPASGPAVTVVSPTSGVASLTPTIVTFNSCVIQPSSQV